MYETPGFFRIFRLSYFSICLKFSQSKALTLGLGFFSFGITYRIEHELGPLLSILSNGVHVYKIQSELHTHISSQLLFNELHICVSTKSRNENGTSLQKGIQFVLWCNQPPEPRFPADFCAKFKLTQFLFNICYLLCLVYQL